MTPLGAPPPAPTDGRQGRVFTMRLIADDEKVIRDLMFQESQLPWGHPSRHEGKPYAFALGSFMVWAAKQWRPDYPSRPSALVLPKPRRRRPGGRQGNTGRRRPTKRKRSRKGKR